MSSKAQSAQDQSGQSPRTLDEINMKILAELRDNGRISMSALAERVNVSRANVYTRVEQLMADGVITGFSARIDPAKAGLGICALVFLSVHPQSWERFRSQISEMTEIESCRITTGEHDAMLLIRGDEVGAIHDFVIGVLAALPEVKSVETVLVLDEVFQRPYLLPSDLPPREPAGAQLGMTRFTRANPGRASLSG
ncbi:Lrp/AsnC family transcriptional regulator [Microterricola viridarii]|uniref:DNA-binding transcriptional regulator, Lrp family n=1 Tax=Microterricola viridarii TaxID=412690 RepID=A0A1H1NFA5_9MICO|nr:Lrp/AsnC family transcriptional regulator [Microterricola viridarii]SDR97515.1 DNA-binding transcriptional regulator, Lrp family [Microterricola viridarii]